MTRHRLIRCDPAQLVRHASTVHATAPDRSAAGDHLQRWRYRVPPAGTTTGWLTRLPDGSVLGWCLEVEPGANGALAHLTVAVVAGRLTLLPVTVQRLALAPFTERELTALARAVEPVAA
ncbi:hypothetical protein SAMN04488543_1722 [Friedmanniella luteola]|uniref:Polyketide cyclase / dehydrase and lipid transport n=2 Tax=Friedmanniella luteola TaxID=546871 RepID=A0A1H1S6L6_9ACTN|nr:hypothetical protein SAMN04488543_1722 [Friedmanniella luteola]